MLDHHLGMHRRRILAALPAALALAALSRPAARAEERRTAGGESYVLIQTVNATVTRFGQRRGVLSVQCGVDAPDGGLRARVTASAPRLRAAYAQVITTYAAALPASGLPDADYLSRELQRQTDAIIGRPGAHFLLGSIIVT